MSILEVIPLPDGTLLKQYRIERMLGHGGFGLTYLVSDPTLRKSFALKEYAPRHLVFRSGPLAIEVRQSGLRERFKRGLDGFLEEARRLAQFSHTNIVRVSRYFEAHGTGYLLMDYEEGGSLRSLLNTRGAPWSEAEIRSLLLPICSGVGLMHDAGLVHGDIKPENVVMRRDGQPVLIDFGAAIHANFSPNDRAVVATPAYAPPEQLSGTGPHGPWLDLFALAATAYELMTGNPPRWVQHGPGFDPAVPYSARDQVAPTLRITPVADVVLEPYSTQLMLAIDRCLEADYRARPRSASDLVRALSRPQDFDTAQAIQGIAGKMLQHFMNWAKPNSGLYTDEFAVFLVSFCVSDFAWRFFCQLPMKQSLGSFIEERRALAFACTLRDTLKERGFASNRGEIDYLMLCERADQYSQTYALDRKEPAWTYALTRKQLTQNCLAPEAANDAVGFSALMENVIDRARGRIAKAVRGELTPYCYIWTESGWQRRLREELD